SCHRQLRRSCGARSAPVDRRRGRQQAWLSRAASDGHGILDVERRRYGAAEENLVHPVPAKVAQQALEPALHASQVQVVTEIRAPPGAFDPRLVGVDLPGMEVEQSRFAV